MGDQYGYLRALPSYLAPLFNEYGFQLFDFSDLQSVGASDVETIDGFHASERATVRILLELQKADATLRPYVLDPAVLETKLRIASPYVVFDTYAN